MLNARVGILVLCCSHGVQLVRQLPALTLPLVRHCLPGERRLLLMHTAVHACLAT